MLADGFYEWQRTDGRKQPCFAGLQSGPAKKHWSNSREKRSQQAWLRQAGQWAG